MSKASCAAVGLGVLLALLASVSCGDGALPIRTVSPDAPPTPLPFGPTPMPVSQSDTIWDWIATNTTECEPILRPTYLPSTLSLVSLHYVDQQRGCVLFGIEYSNDTGNARLLLDVGPFPNPPMPGPDSVGGQVEVRGTTGYYQLQKALEPLGSALLGWNEPGRWGKPQDSWHRDYVEYLIAAEGFSKEELLKVANGLQPVAQ
jgi:hypothetical protein